MNAVIAQIKQEDANRLLKDQARYAELIVAGDPAADEVLELRGIMQRLGKSAEDLQRDHNTIQEALRYELVIEEGAGLDDQIHAKERAIAVYYEESQRIKAERVKKIGQMQNESSELQSRSGAAINSKAYLRKLVNTHPDLFRASHKHLVVETNPNHRRADDRGQDAELAAMRGHV